jgi:hypothetical protein
MSPGILRRLVRLKLAVVSEVHTASIIALMTEAVRTSETSADLYQRVRCNFPEGSHHEMGLPTPKFGKVSYSGLHRMLSVNWVLVNIGTVKANTYFHEAQIKLAGFLNN